MSITEEQTTNGVSLATSTPSFKERLSARRKELEKDVSFELEVAGYEDLWVRYRVLGYDEVRTIGIAIEEETNDQVTGERLTAADTLAEACVELLELKGTDSTGERVFEGLGYRWTPAAAEALFDAHLPQGCSDRDAITAVFPPPRDMLMMTHFQEYMETAMGYLPQIEEVLQGESRGRSAPTTSD